MDEVENLQLEEKTCINTHSYTDGQINGVNKSALRNSCTFDETNNLTHIPTPTPSMPSISASPPDREVTKIYLRSLHTV